MGTFVDLEATINDVLGNGGDMATTITSTTTGRSDYAGCDRGNKINGGASGCQPLIFAPFDVLTSRAVAGSRAFAVPPAVFSPLCRVISFLILWFVFFDVKFLIPFLLLLQFILFCLSCHPCGGQAARRHRHLLSLILLPLELFPRPPPPFSFLATTLLPWHLCPVRLGLRGGG